MDDELISKLLATLRHEYGDLLAEPLIDRIAETVIVLAASHHELR